MKTRLKETLDGWTVQFILGGHTFTLDTAQPRTKDEARQFQRRLQSAFDSHVSKVVQASLTEAIDPLI